MYTQQIFISIFALINLISFFVIANDKARAIRGSNTERIPEGLMFFMATVFGGVGVYVGMLIFRHKTRKWYFKLGIPLLILQNLATLYLISEILVKNSDNL